MITGRLIYRSRSGRYVRLLFRTVPQNCKGVSGSLEQDTYGLHEVRLGSWHLPMYRLHIAAFIGVTDMPGVLSIELICTAFSHIGLC